MWKKNYDELDRFAAEATRRGMTYGQLQQEETVEILRKQGFWGRPTLKKKEPAGIDSGKNRDYNILKEKDYKGRANNMAMSKEDAVFLEKHPEATEIFKLAQLMKEAGFDYWFSYDDDCGTEEIFDEEYEYTIETQTGELIGIFAPITVRQVSYLKGLKLLDMRPARGLEFPADYNGEFRGELTAEQAMEIITEFYKEA